MQAVQVRVGGLGPLVASSLGNSLFFLPPKHLVQTILTCLMAVGGPGVTDAVLFLFSFVVVGVAVADDGVAMADDTQPLQRPLSPLLLWFFENSTMGFVTEQEAHFMLVSALIGNLCYTVGLVFVDRFNRASGK